MIKTRTFLFALLFTIPFSAARAESDLASEVRRTLMVGCLPSILAPDKVTFAADGHAAWDEFLQIPDRVPMAVIKSGRIFMQDVKHVVTSKKYPEAIYLLSSPETLECGVMVVGQWDETVIPMIEEEFNAKPWQPYKLEGDEWKKQLKDWQYFKAYRWDRKQYAIAMVAQRHSLAAENPEGMQLFVKMGITAVDDKK